MSDFITRCSPGLCECVSEKLEFQWYREIATNTLLCQALCTTERVRVKCILLALEHGAVLASGGMYLS